MRDKLTRRLVDSIHPRSKPFEVHDTELRGFSLRIETGGTKTYYLRYQMPDGQRGRFKIGNAEALTIDQARDEAKRKAGEAALGVNPQSERKAKRNIENFGQFVKEEYSPWVRANRKSGNATVKRIEKLFKPLYPLRLNAITPKIIEAWQTERRNDKKTAATINRDTTVLKACLSKAVEWGHISQHPISRVKRLKEDSQPKIRYLRRFIVTGKQIGRAHV